MDKLRIYCIDEQGMNTDDAGMEVLHAEAAGKRADERIAELEGGAAPIAQLAEEAAEAARKATGE